MEIKPSHININDYDIDFNKMKGAIIAIRNKQLRTEIKFHDMARQDIDGYVEGSIMEIWTQMIDDETLNIVHIHVNDTGEEVTMDVAYMHDDENIEIFHDFKTDITGNPLKYKIIVKGCKIHSVLYNCVGKDSSKSLKSIPFQENSIESGSEQMFQSGDLKNLGEKSGVIGRISKIPTGMISSADLNKVQSHQQVKIEYQMVNQCKHRGFDELMGYVDINLESQFEIGSNNQVNFQKMGPMENTQQAQVVCEWSHTPEDVVQKWKEWQNTSAESSIDTFKSEMSKLSALQEEADSIKQDASKNEL